ncbi:chemotaxis protein CheW [Clostridium fallax]|uniref:Purine-binding chemotaxis protein CheW n=1 Tax=Clostridium fallax TaxID=1533 RepID=A0A1M4UN13_9CLOT|nr:chemotaxis protein CheW [Clostridium fallax]SHE58045.1 purine-binding chemotaxis protein CheW [Clostridium fallax]SQB07651.1 chemotaxis protein [Clostridium fallax]
MSKEAKILIFSLNNEYYATDIIQVERILGYEEPTVLPEVPNFLEGVINYENNILPIISLSRKFNFESQISSDSKIIVIKDDDVKLGVTVDNVCEVTDINLDDIEVPPTVGSSISTRYIKGLIRLEDKIVIWLDLSKVLTEDEKEKMA